jgi:AcrR family transcriptional regulator
VTTRTETTPDRRTRRRLETIEEILDIAQDVMNEDGVNALSLSEVARRLGVKPPSLYKYFDSLIAVYDALFERGQRLHYQALHAAAEGAEPGLPTLHALFEASGRWCLANSPIAQLLFFRPVPDFEPTEASMAPSVAMIQMQRDALADAVAAGQLGPGAATDEAIHVLSVFICGTVGQSIANEPGRPWGAGRYSPLLPRLIDLLVHLYPPGAGRAGSSGVGQSGR